MSLEGHLIHQIDEPLAQIHRTQANNHRGNTAAGIRYRTEDIQLRLGAGGRITIQQSADGGTKHKRAQDMIDCNR